MNAWGSEVALTLALSDFRNARQEPGAYYAFTHSGREHRFVRRSVPAPS